MDPALFSAIVSDFDLANEAELSSARATLDALKQSALEQDSTLFDPSGNSSHDDGRSYHDNSSSGVGHSRSEETDTTSLSGGLHTLSLHKDLSGNSEDNYITEAEKLDTPTKIVLLKEMFPDAGEFSVSHTLKKCHGNYNRALEELLNHAFFKDGSTGSSEEKIISTGIDAFSEGNVLRRGRKRKDKKHKQLLNSAEEPRASSLPPAPKTSAWEKGLKDVEFISSRTNLSAKTVSSIYHQCGTSIPATLVALIESPPASSGSTTPASAVESIIQVNAFELGKDFPFIPPSQLAGLIRLTHPSTAAAHELARALTTPVRQANGGIEVIPRYAPVDTASDIDDGDSWKAASSKQRFHAATPPSYPDPAYHRSLAQSHSLLADQSFSQASEAYRRGRSDHLMSAAAGYYSQVGRDHAAKRAEATADAADSLVASQSTAALTDLHGVTVKDAVRIARQRTEHWWRTSDRRVMGLDGRVKKYDGAGDALTIVTGVGRHSQGGVARIGPAVGRMLVQEGWHVAFGEGVLTVTGRRR